MQTKGIYVFQGGVCENSSIKLILEKMAFWLKDKKWSKGWDLILEKNLGQELGLSKMKMIQRLGLVLAKIEIKGQDLVE